MHSNDQLQRLLQSYQDQLTQLNQLIRNTGNALNTQIPSPAMPATQGVQPAETAQQSSGVPAGQQELLLKLYDEFVTTDDGKQLAAGLGKFARFAQSKVDKSK